MTSYKAPQDGALLESLFSLFPQQSRTSVKNMLSKGQVQVNGEVKTAFDHPCRGKGRRQNPL